MEDVLSNIKNAPIDPKQLAPDSKFRFKCHKDVPCFNKCCSELDIFLTPYDILRMKNALNMTSSEFLDKYTETVILEKTQLPFIRLKMEESGQCRFVTEEGCKIYTDRPLACRYYPLGFGVMQSSKVEGSDFYFLIQEDHCKGFEEESEWNVQEWRDDQGISDYDDMNKDWVDIIIKKKANPDMSPDERSKNLFFLGSYDIDSFKPFVFESRFFEVFDITEDEIDLIKNDEDELLRFAQRWLLFVLYKEPTMALKEA
ncbi:MAG: YkgJ family cysteine cluster protein [Nitrospirota bacterium]|nr:MAG: YkgJ family cysteine cluster protein [Nitrospirota bacterium]